MDMQMPVMDGLTATVEIRKLEAFRNVPIIAMTANVMQADIQKCVDAGMIDHVAKPIDPDELFGKLARWVKQRPAGAAQEISAIPPKKPVAIQASSPDDLPYIPGLDTAIGLKRAMGKKPFYLDMLRMYVDNQGEIPAQIRKSLADGDYETAQRLAHTAKGVSGNIGATGLQELAARVEKAFRERDSREMIEPLIAELAAVHGKLVGGLKETLRSLNAGAEENAEVLQVDRERAVAACQKLEQLLANADGEATDFLNEARDVFRGFLGAHPFQVIKKAIDDYDFDQAMEVLKNRQMQAP